MMNAAITILTFFSYKDRIAGAVFAQSVVGTVINTFTALFTLFTVQMYFESGKLPGQLIRSVYDAAEPETGNIPSRSVLLQHSQKSGAI